ncbi:MAG: hypothetical protein CR975_01125 [Gammaproteobacteria bacterium]|nr:MAG: hypothetical protein CR975_01125 [Gammaproteobacteria bacterium]
MFKIFENLWYIFLLVLLGLGGVYGFRAYNKHLALTEPFSVLVKDWEESKKRRSKKENCYKNPGYCNNLIVNYQNKQEIYDIIEKHVRTEYSTRSAVHYAVGKELRQLSARYANSSRYMLFSDEAGFYRIIFSDCCSAYEKEGRVFIKVKYSDIPAHQGKSDTFKIDKKEGDFSLSYFYYSYDFI